MKDDSLCVLGTDLTFNPRARAVELTQGDSGNQY